MINHSNLYGIRGWGAYERHEAGKLAGGRGEFKGQYRPKVIDLKKKVNRCKNLFQELREQFLQFEVTTSSSSSSTSLTTNVYGHGPNGCNQYDDNNSNSHHSNGNNCNSYRIDGSNHVNSSSNQNIVLPAMNDLICDFMPILRIINYCSNREAALYHSWCIERDKAR